MSGGRPRLAMVVAVAIALLAGTTPAPAAPGSAGVVRAAAAASAIDFVRATELPLTMETLPGTPGSGFVFVHGVAQADLNDDDTLDVVVAVHRYSGASPSSYVAVLLGRGDGTFDDPVSYPVPLSTPFTPVTGVVVGDFDGDGDGDVVASTPDRKEVVHYANDGSGALGAAVFTPTGDGIRPDALAAADVDGDGADDLFALAPEDDAVAVLESLGDGTFAAPVVLATGNLPRTFSVGDFDGVAGPDVAVATDSSRVVSVFLSAGGFTYEPSADISLFGGALWPVHVWAAELTGDGVVDLAVTGENHGTVGGAGPPCRSCLVTLAGASDGTFTAVELARWAPVDRVAVAASGDSRAFYPGSAADIDGDGRADVAIAHEYDALVTTAISDGAGGWRPSEWVARHGEAGTTPPENTHFGPERPTGWVGRGALIGDHDGDGTADVLAAGDAIRASLGAVALLRGDPAAPGRLLAPALPRTNATVPVGSQSMVITDWTGDGAPDVVVGDGTSIRVLGNRGGGTVNDAIAVPTQAARRRCNQIAAADLDGDGNVDLVCWQGDAVQPEPFVLYGDGAGGVDQVVDTEGTSDGATPPSTLAIADVDGDGDGDLVHGGHLASGAAAFVQRNGGPDRTWTETAAIPVGKGSAVPIAAGDVDGDGAADVVIRSNIDADGRVADRLLVALSNGDGTFAAPTETASGTGPDTVNALAVADLDGDDALDLVLSETTRFGSEGGFVFTALGDNDGSFEPARAFPASPLGDLAVDDLDGDGHPDVVVGSYGFGLEVLPGNGDGTLGEPRRFASANSRINGVALGHLDADDRLDVVAARQIGGFSNPPGPALAIHLSAPPSVPPRDPADLAVTALEGPDEVTPGADGHVEYTVANTGGPVPAGARWTDTLWVSDDDTWNVGDRLVDTIERTGPLAAGGEYTREVDAPLLPLLDGPHHLVVRLDSRHQLAEPDEGDNIAISAVVLDVPDLAVDGAPLDATVVAGRNGYVAVPVVAGQAVLLTVDTARGGVAAVDALRDRVPGPAVDRVLPDVDATQRTVLLPAGGAGLWFVRLRGLDGAGAGAGLSLRAITADFGVLSAAPQQGSNAGSTTVTLRGTGLDRAVRVVLVGPTTEVAATLQVVDAETLRATFPLQQQPTGTYDIVVDGPAGSQAVLADAFEVTDAPAGHLELYVLGPPSVRGGWSGKLQVTVRNTGATDVGVDAVRVSGNGEMRLDTADDAPFSPEPIVLLPGDPDTAVGPVPAGPIPPGAARRALIEFRPTGAEATFDVEVFPTPSPQPAAIPQGFVIDAVDGPGAVLTGTTTSIEWRIRNAGGAPMTGPWPLLIGLAGDATIREGSVVERPSTPTLARVDVGAGVTLAPGEAVELSAPVSVDLALHEPAHWFVRHESAPPTFMHDPDDPPSATDFATDVEDAISWEATTVEVTVPGVGLGPPAVGTIGPGQRRLLRIASDEGASVVGLEVGGGGGGGSLRLLAAPGVIPEDVSRVMQLRVDAGSVGSAGLEVDGDTMYLLLDGDDLAGPASYEVSLTRPDPAIAETEPVAAGNGGSATVRLSGAGLDDATAVRLVRDGTTRDADVWRAANPFDLAATFDLTGLTAGPATLVVERGGEPPLTHPFSIVDGSGGELTVDIEVPESMRFDAPNPITLHYSNTGVNDLPLPLLTVVAQAGGPISVFPDRIGADSSPTLVPPPPIAAFPSIPPGATGTVVLWHVPPETAAPLAFDVHATSFDDPALASRPLDWAGIADEIKPDGADDAAWAARIAAERARYGETYGDLGRYIAARYAALGAAGLRPVFVDGQWLFWPAASGRPRALRGQAVAPTTGVAARAPAGGAPDAVLAQAASGDGVQNVYAVVIGDPDGTLPGASRDGRAMTALLTDTYNVPTSQVRHLEGDVTKAQALNAIATMRNAPGMDGDDLFMVFNAGHGEFETIDRTDTIPDADEAYNRFSDGKIFGREWAAVLDGAPAPVLFINDSCRSGIITNGVSQLLGDRVVTLASADYYGKVLDHASYGRTLVSELQRDPGGDFYAIAQRAADEEAKAYDAEHGGAGTAWATQVRGGTIDRRFSSAPELVSAYEQAFSQGLIDGRDRPQYPTLDRNGVDSLSIVPPDPKGSAATEAGDEQEEDEPAATDEADGNHGQPLTEPTPDGPDAGTPRPVSAPPTRSSPDDAGRFGIDGDWPGSDCCGPGSNNDPLDDHTVVPVLQSGDPNDIVGPAGSGPERFVAGDSPFGYQVRFENLGPGSTHNPDGLPLATAPAVLVDVTGQLDADLDWSTFELGSFGVGAGGGASGYPAVRFDPPPGLTAWSGEELVTVPVFGTPSTTQLLVRASAVFDPLGGTLRSTITGLDPATGDIPVDARVGFLPPEDGSGAGQGFADYSVRPVPDLPTGTTVDAAATIVFDANPPIATPRWTNTVDAGAPDAAVAPLAPTTSGSQFTVSWSGTDDASGIGRFDVYASVDGAPFELWQDDVAAQSAPYDGVVGHAYAFFAAAIDNVGHREAPGTAAEATTSLVAAPAPPDDSPPPTPPPSSPSAPPASPPGGRFGDDDGNVHEAMIEAIAARGITLGCSPDGRRYCPAAAVTRGQMAAFLVRALGLPPTSGDRFRDDAGSPFEDAVNRLAEAGIVTGFRDGTYRPAAPVSRAQMASLLARAFHLPAVTGNRFGDVSGVHTGDINAIAAAGITVGCTADGRSFCPDAPVRRDQMASFLGRALGLRAAAS